MDEASVLVVGGGATGTGIARDLAMRGLDVTVLERGSLAAGASGHSHGLLHSGARYAVEDSETAAECIAENRVLRDVASHCVEPTGGLFVELRADDPAYFERKAAACRDAAITTTRYDRREALETWPYLAAETERALGVPDGVVDGFGLAVANAVDARNRGATVHTGAEVLDLLVEGGAVAGVEVSRDGTTGAEVLAADHVVNAAGAWAGRVAAMAGVDVGMAPASGAMAAVDHPGVGTVLNRCRPPADGDIVVPAGGTAVLGTTSRDAPDPDAFETSDEEVRRLREQGGRLVPALASADVVEAYWGVRPLYSPPGEASGRAGTRGHAVLDHAARDGRPGFTSVVGGKLTTYRLMAEAAADHVCGKLGVDAPCRTAAEPLWGRDDPAAFAAALAEFGPRPPAPGVDRRDEAN